jgi:hypothetical protein
MKKTQTKKRKKELEEPIGKMVAFDIKANDFHLQDVVLHDGKCLTAYRALVQAQYPTALIAAVAVFDAYAARTACTHCGELFDPERAAKELAKRDRLIVWVKRRREARLAEIAEAGETSEQH